MKGRVTQYRVELVNSDNGSDGGFVAVGYAKADNGLLNATLTIRGQRYALLLIPDHAPTQRSR